MAPPIVAPRKSTAWQRWVVPVGLSCAGGIAAALALGPANLARTALLDAILVALVVVGGWGVGEPIRRSLVVSGSRADAVLTAGALGLAAMALTFFVLGSGHVLSRTTVTLVVVCGLASAAWYGKSLRPSTSKQAREPHSAHGAVLAVSCLIVGAVTAAGALVPETFFDALEYHDALPALFLRLGRIEVFPSSVHSAMPANVDLLFLPLLAWSGSGAVKLMHFALYLGSCAWVWALARREHGREAGVAAALLFGSLPGVAVMAGLGAVDLGVTFFSLGAFALLTATCELGGRRTLVAAGLLAGAAAGAKYSALPVVLVAASLAGGLRLRASRRVGMALVDAIVVLAAATVTAGPWYARNLMAFGNPLYPAGSPPGTSGAWAYERLRHDSTPPYQLRDAWRLPGDVVLERRAFGAGGEVWPGGLLVGLALLLGLTRKGNDRALAAAGLVLVASWAGTVLVLRYLYPALALGSVLAGGMLLGRERGRGFRALAVAAVVLAAATGTVRQLAIRRVLYGPTLPVLLGGESREAFLDRLVPSAAAARWVLENTDPKATKLLLIGETEAFYFDRNFEPVSGYDRHPLADWMAAAKTAEGLRGALRARGFTHVVLNLRELERLDRSYSHLPLDERGGAILRDLLTASVRRYDDGRVSVWSLR